MAPSKQSEHNSATRDSAAAIFWVFLRLGLTSFGGPVAHLGYFRAEFVTRRRWLNDRSYADLVALAQFLPGPASSQVGLSLGLMRGGFRGALAAWVGFTLPSAVALVLFALGLSSWGAAVPAGVLQGLKIVAVAVVAQAVWGMAGKLCTDGIRAAIMVAATCITLWWATAWAQIGVISIAGAVGLLVIRPAQESQHEPLSVPLSRAAGLIALSLFAVLLVGLPMIAEVWPTQTLAVINAFYRAGALVFGGGHVVLPLLQASVVPAGWLSNETFLAGYGAAQAVPGPLFTFAAFLGASMEGAPTGWSGALLCLGAIYLPSFLLVVGALPFWEKLRRSVRSQAALAGVNAAVVGLLLAALYRPVWTSAIHAPPDFGLALAAFAALMFWQLPPWLVVVGCAGGGWILAALL